MEGQNIALEYRHTEGKADRLPALAAELVRLKVDVIVTESNAAALAAKNATQTILLKEAVPKIALVAVVWNPADPAAADLLRETEAGARSLGLKIHAIEVRAPTELDAAFKAVADARPSAFFTLPGGMFQDDKTRILQFATKSRLPGVFPNRAYAEAGGLISYGPNLAANFRRAAAFVDKILKGAKPADLPIEQPATFELVVNLKTAKALGITIPASVRARADQVIE